MPLITVYITNYNYGEYLQQAVESVLNQTFNDYEILLIDDGSTDDSKTIIEEKYSSNSRIKIIYQQNKGLNVTNNIALNLAFGKYIMRLDADDYLDPNALLVMSNILERDIHLGLVFPDYYMVDKFGNIINIERRHNFAKDVSLYDQPAHGACTMVRKSYLQQLGGYNEQYRCQDGYELWIKFVTKYKVANINTPLFYYRQHGSNLTSNEERILSTRINIKQNYLIDSGHEEEEAIAIIPIRGKNNRRKIAFQKIGDKYLIDWKIEEMIKVRNISKLVITSSDEELERYILERYKNNNRLLFIKRPEVLERLNTNLSETVHLILNIPDICKFSPAIITIVAIDYPFVTASIVEDAINTLEVFKSDSLISVRPLNSVIYQHDGGGMKPMLNQEKFTKLEREILYQYAGGIIVTRKSTFDNYQKLIAGKVGHIVITQKAALNISSKLDIDIVDHIAMINK